MRYSDENQQGLLSLLAASQAGLDPTTAYGMLQDIQGEQEALNAQRQERQSGLIGMLMEAAQGGMPYAGASALLDAAPGPMGPALQSALSSLYPEGAPATNASGAEMDFPTGSRPTPSGLSAPVGPSGMQYPVAQGLGQGAESLSPVFNPPEPSFSDQQAMMEMEQQQALDADLTALQADATAARANERTVDEYLAEVMAQNPELFATAPEEAMAIIENTFGSAALQTRGLPGIG